MEEKTEGKANVSQQCTETEFVSCPQPDTVSPPPALKCHFGQFRSSLLVDQSGAVQLAMADLSHLSRIILLLVLLSPKR